MLTGALAGMIGGMVMAMWSMGVLWITHLGFWEALNLIGHTFWRGAPLGPEFSFGAAMLGFIVHMMMSMVLGVVFVLGVHRFQANVASLAGLGMAFGLVCAWLRKPANAPDRLRVTNTPCDKSQVRLPR
ncbi:hypothetical protein MSM1_08005 [Mycobacterium sp. SM1]|uniref:hypothetical protein n=1 Tax=Mycobacterium sp. SM1 TaxID=2816243 RepID=UPI001BCE711B|nr:hypothetical protein [Mycobacterium sp. SM1]MBS4728288.1 hypothetical protein [Mycobacterium sp. SM1]